MELHKRYAELHQKYLNEGKELSGKRVEVPLPEYLELLEDADKKQMQEGQSVSVITSVSAGPILGRVVSNKLVKDGKRQITIQLAHTIQFLEIVF